MPKSRGEDWSHHTRPSREAPQGPQDESLPGSSSKGDKYYARVRSRTPPRSHDRTTSEQRRSASPERESRRSHRSDSHHRHNHHHHHRHHHDHHDHRSDSKSHHGSRSTAEQVELPFSARPLTKSDFRSFEPLFAYYLNVQKQRYLEDMDDREIRGRWKSFVGKWNRNELAEGWYDPEMFSKRTAEYVRPEEDQEVSGREASEPAAQAPVTNAARSVSPDRRRQNRHSSDEDDYGPTLPSGDPRRAAGVSIPSMQDLSVRDEMIQEQREADREELRAARKADRTLQKERLEELVPRAEAGTRERKLEKRKETNEKMKEFRDKSPGMEGGNEQELMGGGDSLAEYKQMKEKEQKRKSERQIRREEFERAKREEMEDRRRAWQEREEGTVSMLRELARQRFG